MHRFFTTLGIFFALAMFAKAFPVASPRLVEVSVPRECDEGDKVLKSMYCENRIIEHSLKVLRKQVRRHHWELRYLPDCRSMLWF
ncbi:hypothetical protein DPSP01_012460 [Paraphaeosphaeria sporulosa]